MAKRQAPPQTGGVVTEEIRRAFLDWQAALEVPNQSRMVIEDVFLVLRKLVHDQPGLSLLGTIQELEQEYGRAVLFPQYGKGPKP